MTCRGSSGSAAPTPSRLVRQLQPDILINNRTGDGGDYDTPEQRIGKFQMDRPWESCMTISAHNVWAWGGANDGVKSLAACLEMVIRAAGGDGNVLLNVGPRPDGLIDPEQASRLKEIGAWLGEERREHLWHARRPVETDPIHRQHAQGQHRFSAHPASGRRAASSCPRCPAEIKSAALLDGGKVEFSQDNGKLTITVPKASLDAIDTIVRLELDGPALDLPVLSFAPAIKARASNTYQNDDQYDPQQAFDHDPATRWATDSGTKQAWISADLGQTKTIVGVRIQEAAPNAGRVQKFEFQYRDGGDWKTIFTGEKIGARFEKKV